MEKEKFFMPSVDPESIGPDAGLTDEERHSNAEHRERERPVNLSKHILKWWKGDAHTHSKESTREGFGYTEGIYDIEEMMEYYKEIGMEFACFTEHASKPGEPEIQSADSEISQSLLQQAERVTELNKEGKIELAALSGVEANVLFDENGNPAIDIPSEVLEKLDLVIASRHQIDREKDPQAIRETLLFAVNHPNIDVIGHPDRYTRKDKEKSPEYWEEYWAIWPEILQEMEEKNKAFDLNLNAPPARKLLEMAAKTNIKFFINFDAHDFNQHEKEKSELSKSSYGPKDAWAKQDAQEEDMSALKKYKEERLSQGPGSHIIKKLLKVIKELESLGVTPDRIVNSSKDNLIQFLTEDRGKTTENLENIVA